MTLGYQAVRTNLSLEQMNSIICSVQESDIFDLGDDSHVYVSGTQSRVGYIGNDGNVELLRQRGKRIGKYHSKLRKIFMSA